MKCSIKGCDGHYEPREIVHTVRKNGEIKVIEHVPAEVCCVCGDILLAPETIRRLEVLLGEEGFPVRSAPVYEYVN